jgi:hypothetical protein
MFVRNMGFIAMEVERLISELHRTCVDPGRPDRAAAAAALILIWPFGVNLDPPSIAVLLRREFNTDQMRTVYEGWLPLRPAEIATPPRRLESEDEGAGEPEQDFGVSDLEQSEDEF